MVRARVRARVRVRVRVRVLPYQQARAGESATWTGASLPAGVRCRVV